MLAVDIVLRENTYDFAEMAAAERWLSDRDIAITSANLVTSELIKGRRPAVLNQSHCQGLLFDGWVTDIHCAIAEELGLPYVVVGNHPVSPQIPQVRLDVEKIMGRMIDHLISMHSNQPIALLIRPPKLHIAHELLAAYLSKAQKLPQQESRLQLAAENSVTPAVQRLVASHKGPFSLITTEQETGAVVDAYHQLGLDPSQYPIVTIAAPSGLRASDRARVHLMPHPGGVLIIEALSRFLEAFQAGKNSVQASIDLGPILPPTQGGN
jgi:DNA-binding LacI/PurR family transcriptional regulator